MGGRWRKGWPYRRLLSPIDIQALWHFSLGLQRREDWNSTLPEIRPDQNQNSSSLPRGGDPVSNPQLRLRALRPDSCIQDWGTRKRGRIGRVKERKERGKGREVNKVSCSLPSRGTLASCPGQEETRDKRVPVVAAGSDPLAGKLAPEYPEWSGCQSQ